jgi:hypothetical protein
MLETAPLNVGDCSSVRRSSGAIRKLLVYRITLCRTLR